MHFSSLWRSLSGGQQNLFAEIKMFNKFNTSGGSVINLEVRWASASFSSILSCCPFMTVIGKLTRLNPMSSVCAVSNTGNQSIFLLNGRFGCVQIFHRLPLHPSPFFRPNPTYRPSHLQLLTLFSVPGIATYSLHTAHVRAPGHHPGADTMVVFRFFLVIVPVEIVIIIVMILFTVRWPVVPHSAPLNAVWRVSNRARAAAAAPCRDSRRHRAAPAGAPYARPRIAKTVDD